VAKARVCCLDDGMWIVEVEDGDWRRWGSFSFPDRDEAEGVARYALRLMRGAGRKPRERWEVE
jgi:hypothetical protein